VCVCVCVSGCISRFLGEVKCVNTDSVHIVCSTNCVYCTVTYHVESSHVHDTRQVTNTSHNENSCIREPYTSEKLSRLRSGYKLLSTPSSVVKFNFNNQQVCNIVTLLFISLVLSPLVS